MKDPWSSNPAGSLLFCRKSCQVCHGEKDHGRKGCAANPYKTARDNLRKKGVVEFECSDSETSEAEPQGKVDTRTKKRKRSSK